MHVCRLLTLVETGRYVLGAINLVEALKESGHDENDRDQALIDTEEQTSHGGKETTPKGIAVVDDGLE